MRQLSELQRSHAFDGVEMQAGSLLNTGRQRLQRSHAFDGVEICELWQGVKKFGHGFNGATLLTAWKCLKKTVNMKAIFWLQRSHAFDGVEMMETVLIFISGCEASTEPRF